VVSIGQQGLTAAVLHEIDISLNAHELIKIRVFNDERADRDAMLARICDELDAAPVQHLGKMLIVWRPAPKIEVPTRRAVPVGTSAARKAPQVRRPRSPLPRVPARPSPRGKARAELPATPGSRRRKSVASEAWTRVHDGEDPARRRPKGAPLAKAVAPRTNRRRAGAGAFKGAAQRGATPHGKSASSLVGASGARRRRRKAG
jgi:RNA-binding protein